MAYRELHMVEVKEVLRLWSRGHGFRTGASRTGVDRKTVRRYVELPAGHGRAERRAHVEVRVAQVTLRLQDDRTSKTWPRAVAAVWAREVDAPAGTEALDWLLLTTHPVETPEDAPDVVIGHPLRWRVEEFHKSWKSAGCTVELTQLEREHGVKLWATILASVAVRILRLTYLAQTAPDLPASVEFMEIEVAAAYLMNKRTRAQNVQPTLADITFLIARAGGHAPGRRLGRPSLREGLRGSRLSSGPRRSSSPRGG